MATRNIVPRDTGEGSIGTTVKRWFTGFFDNLNLGRVSANYNELAPIDDNSVNFGTALKRWFHGYFANITVGHITTEDQAGKTCMLPDDDDAASLGDALHRWNSVHAINLIGNADTVTKWQTPRTVTLSGDASGNFTIDGSANVGCSVAIANDSHNHDGRYFTESEANSRFVNSIGGNAATASKWQTARTVTFSGDATGSFSIDGSANKACSLAIVNDSHTHDSRYYTNTQANGHFVNVTGDNMTGHLNFNSAARIRFGSGSGMNVYHDGTNGHMRVQTGYLYLTVEEWQAALVAIPDGEVILYHNNIAKIWTTPTGVVVDGTVQSPGSDIAEKYTCAEEQVIPGTVMKACESGDYEVEECNIELCANVVGVCSVDPGYILNSESEGIVVGLTGKVPVRIIGPVGKGKPIVPAGQGAARAIREDSELLYKIGQSVEENLEQEEKLVMCIIK